MMMQGDANTLMVDTIKVLAPPKKISCILNFGGWYLCQDVIHQQDTFSISSTHPHVHMVISASIRV